MNEKLFDNSSGGAARFLLCRYGQASAASPHCLTREAINT